MRNCCSFFRQKKQDRFTLWDNYNFCNDMSFVKELESCNSGPCQISELKCVILVVKPSMCNIMLSFFPTLFPSETGDIGSVIILLLFQLWHV